MLLFGALVHLLLVLSLILLPRAYFSQALPLVAVPMFLVLTPATLLLGLLLQDLFQQARDRQALRESAARLRAVSEANPDLTLVLDEEGRKSGEVFPEWLTISAVRDERGRVSNYVASLTDSSERKSAAEEIKHLAFYDALTGLPNRRLLRDRLQQARALSRRNGQHAALVFLDLDNFKNVNDLYGHQVGDELLCQVAERLRHSLRERDSVARLGGDEFVLMIEGLETRTEEAASQVEHLGAKVLDGLRQPYLAGGHRLFSSASLGVVLFNDEQYSVDELMQRADLSMYTAKAAGKNALSFYDPQMQEAVSARLQLEEDLRRGGQDGEFLLSLQPQVDQLGRLSGAEPLVRWQHPQRDLLAPGAFIAIAERCGLIEALAMQMLGAACALLAQWAPHPHSAGLSLSVNLSARLLYQADFVEALQQTLQHSGANPQFLRLELTESLLLTDMDKASGRMQTLRDIGIRCSIDDFGTGYSSMAYLQQLPLDQLKIDQSFTRELPDNPSSLAIVRAIIALAQSLKLEVIAESVASSLRPAAIDEGHGLGPFQVASLQLGDGETASVDQRRNVAIEVAAAGQGFPVGRQPLLPAHYRGIRGQAVFAEQQAAARFQYPAHLLQRGHGVRDGTQGKGTDDAVETGLAGLDLAQFQGDHLYRYGAARGAAAGQVLHFGRGVDADDRADFRRIVEPQIQSAADADLQHPSLGQRDDLRAGLHYLAHAAGEVDQVRQDVAVIQVHGALRWDQSSLTSASSLSRLSPRIAAKHLIRCSASPSVRCQLSVSASKLAALTAARENCQRRRALPSAQSMLSSG